MHQLTYLDLSAQGPVGVSNKHVETAIDEGSGKLTMLYQVNTISAAVLHPIATMGTVRNWIRKVKWLIA